MRYVRLFLLLLTAVPPVSASHDILTSVLGDHVRDGRVDYAAIKLDPRFWTYIAWLEQQDPDQLQESSERLAFWINAYNAFTIKVVCDHYPVRSIKDLSTGIFGSEYLTKTTVWDKKVVRLRGRELSLNEVEHDIIRKQFREPRIHFALVCAARSCPPLRREAYEGKKLDAQLTDQTRIFLAQTDNNRIDIPNRIVYLSKIFKWYAGDFAPSVLDFIDPYVSSDDARAIRRDRSAFRVDYTEYDWALNEP